MTTMQSAQPIPAPLSVQACPCRSMSVHAHPCLRSTPNSSWRNSFVNLKKVQEFLKKFPCYGGGGGDTGPSDKLDIKRWLFWTCLYCMPLAHARSLLDCVR